MPGTLACAVKTKGSDQGVHNALLNKMRNGCDSSAIEASRRTSARPCACCMRTPRMVLSAWSRRCCCGGKIELDEEGWMAVRSDGSIRTAGRVFS
jgi:hypothetical protein